MARKKETMNIAVISQYSFPYGMAATNRILAYCGGLVQNAAKVDVIIPFQTDYSSNNEELPISGDYSGINYYYSYKRYRSEHKLIRGCFSKLMLKYIVGCYTSIKLLIKLSTIRKYDVLLVSSDTFSILIFFNYVAHHIGAKSIFIFDEYPIPIRHKLKDKIPFYKTYMYKKILKRYDAYISISNNLKDYYCTLSNKPTFVLPVILNEEKFNINKSFDNSEKNICYMGNMELAKDNVDLIINAFSKIAIKYKDINLHLYGSPKQSAEKLIRQLIESLNLSKRVFLKGYLHSSQVLDVLVNSFILVSSQPETKRAAGGFPTKLGEYLSTGVPSLFTNVGENASYVNEGEHVFFAQPHNVEDYADKLEFIIHNYSYATTIAQQGKDFVLQNYASKEQGKKMIAFFTTLRN